MYGLKVLILSDSDTQKMDKWHRTLLHQILGLPESTAACAIYLLLGTLPMSGIVGASAFTMFNSIYNCKGSVKYEILTRQLAVKGMTSNSWTTYFYIRRYHLPSLHSLTRQPPRKRKLKKEIKKKISNYYELQMKAKAMEMQSGQIL
jgi:hypothetical protein